MEDQTIKPPVLFIAQKQNPNPKLNAQSFFYSKNKVIKEVEQKEPELTASDSKSKKSRFKEMTLDEKLEYLSDTATILPKMKCKIITKSTSYNCEVDQYDETYVLIKPNQSSKTVRIKKDDIREILLIGF